MAIILGIITGTTGKYTSVKRNVSVEWLLYSDNLLDFTGNIAVQGTAAGDNLILPNNESAGWLAPGKEYRMGSDYLEGCVAGEIEITDRKIIRGTGKYEIQVGDNTVGLVPLTPQGIVQYKAVQHFSTSETDNQEKNKPPANNDKFSISSDVEYKEMPFEKDVRTNAFIVNSAGQKFIPPVSYRKAVTVYSLTRTEYINPIAKSRIYRNVVNSDTWYGAAPGTVLMDSISPSKEKDGHWTVSYKFKYDPDGWEIYILDTGTMQKDSSGKLSAILDKEQAAVQEPVKLDGSGHPLDDQSSDGTDLGPFWAYKEMPFAALNIPDFSTING
ncbi:hypothetical protein FACS18942_04910 [Planctomycetales bacterium]|nr:hypothetical protein FACS18942_04910 [Planctomycetales bacterium]GHT33815.1 hypothetical protein FACS189427_00050 [Planctomycetales bacterium]